MTHTPEPQARRAAPDGSASNDGTPGLRAYSRPELVEYGPLAKLTQGTASGTGEVTPTGVKRKRCL